MTSNKPSKEELRFMLDEGFTLYQISRNFNTTVNEVHKWRVEYDMTTSLYKIPRPTKQDLESMYTDECMIQKEIGKEFGVHLGTISIWLSTYGIPTRGSRGTLAPQIPKKDVLERMYVAEGMTQEQIAKRLYVGHVLIGIWLKYHHIPTRRTGPLRFPMPSKDVLERMYNDEGNTQEQVAKEFDVSRVTVVNWMSHYDIQARYNVPMPPKEELESLILEGLNQLQIAKHYGVSDWKVFDWCECLDVHGMVNNFRCTTPEHINWRDNVFQRDNYTCQECGEAAGSVLQAHHIKPYRDYPELELDPDNGITLCEQCHYATMGNEYEYICKYEDIVLRDRCIGDSFIKHHTVIDSLPGESPLELHSIIDY